MLEYDAFIRSIKQNKNVSHAVLLGAGASISSQIQSAADCIWEWKRDIYSSNNPNTTLIVSNFRSEAVRRSIQAWLDAQGEYPLMGSSDEYSFYAEKAYPIEADRQKYFEQLAYNKAPYIGYKLLCMLNNAGIVKSVWTTNFDGLTERAAHQMNITPIRFDAVYSGFLGSFEQLDIVKEFFSLFKREDNLILVDPVMGDNGELYKIFTPKFAKGMRSLCERADIIVPNLTEAALLLGEPYQAGPYTKAYIDGILHKLSQLGPKQVVLTGVYFDEKELGAATFDMERNATEYVLTEKIPGYYHGTGDVFASALLSGLLNNFNLERSAEIAVRFTAESILRTFKAQTDYRFGVNFEQSIPDLLKELKLI